MLSKLIELLANETCRPASEIQLSTRLDSLVDDSLEFLCLISEVKEQFGADIPNSVLTDVQTVEDLFGAIHDHLPARTAS